MSLLFNQIHFLLFCKSQFHIDIYILKVDPVYVLMFMVMAVVIGALMIVFMVLLPLYNGITSTGGHM